ncbi:MAG: FAD-binding oxidoreductase [Nitrosospira sp.]|nr:FAD-binding oxidoreductase [Nitrosospira sp.]
MELKTLPVALVEELQEQLGRDKVIVEVSELEMTSRTCIPYGETPAAAVYPISAEQVQIVVRLANAFNVPIWPVSTGKNWGYGEKTACYPGGITMILERMTRIWEVNEELGYAVIEPGVTYKQLNDHLKQKHPALWSDSAGTTQFASVLGNALDKGRGLTPYANHFECLCGLDVVLPNGELLETGGGPQSNNNVRHTYKLGVGPSIEGLFAQSNLGIVVKSGIWLMPAPECFDWAAFEYTTSDEKFGAFIDDLRQLVFRGALRSHPHLANDFAMMCIVSQYPFDLLDGARCLSERAMETWRKQHGIARWTFGCGLYGSPAEVRFQKQAIKRVLGRYGRIQFVGAAIEDNWHGRLLRQVAPLVNRMLGKSDAAIEALVPAINLFRGIPTDHFVRQVYFKSHQQKPVDDIDPARDQCGLLWIGPVVPFASRHVMHALTLAKDIFARHECDFFVEIIVESPRSIILLIGVFYARNDPADAVRARAWYNESRDAFLKNGYPPYRVTTMSMPGSLDRNPVARDFLRTIKNAVDPLNLVAPGRYGISAQTHQDTASQQAAKLEQ